MTVGTRTTRIRRAGPSAVVAVLLGALLAACGNGPGGGTPRPTDPRVVLSNAIAATAALPTLRLHAELVANVGALVGGPATAVMKGALDADIDLATRQLVARTTSTTPNLNGNGNAVGAAQQQVSDMIITQTASFNRDSQTGRWSKFPSNLAVGPTNAQIATMISNLLSNPAMTFELKDAASCTLGTCDHVIAHIDGATLGPALGALRGGPATAGIGMAIPNFDIDVLVDQSTSVISELRTGLSMGGTSDQVLLQISNPGQPVQIAPPPAAITDDVGANFGGGGGVGAFPAPTPMPLGPEESMILDEVGNQLESAMPDGPAPSIP